MYSICILMIHSWNFRDFFPSGALFGAQAAPKGATGAARGALVKPWNSSPCAAMVKNGGLIVVKNGGQKWWLNRILMGFDGI